MKIIIATLLLAFSCIPYARESSVRPNDSEIICTKDVDCVMISSSCNGCCQQEAINTTAVAKFNVRVDACAKIWRGGVCDCINMPEKAICKNQKCRSEPIEAPPPK